MSHERADMPDELRDAMARLDRIVRSFEAEPNDSVRERALELIETVDAVHRPLVWRLGEAIWRADEQVFRSLLDDPVASLLFELYGITSPARRREEAEAPAGYVAVEDLVRTIPPSFGWKRAASVEEVPEGGLLARSVEGTAILLVRAGDAVRAYRDQCPGSPLAIGGGQVEGTEIVCPWHLCRFDLATGERTDREGAGLEEVPVEVAQGTVRVGLRSAVEAA